MLKIEFSKAGKPISDYDIEAFYQAVKHSDATLYISNALLLDRFRVGVKEKDINGYILTVVDFDGTITTTKQVCGSLAHTENVLTILDDLLDRVIDWGDGND